MFSAAQLTESDPQIIHPGGDKSSQIYNSQSTASIRQERGNLPLEGFLEKMLAGSQNESESVD